MHHIKTIIFHLFILLLFTTSYGFAEEQAGADCDFDFKGYEKDILKKIPPSMIFSRTSKSTTGDILVEIEGAETFIFGYGACNKLNVKIRVSSINPAHLNSILDFIQPLILQAAVGMADVFESLKPHMAKTINNLEIDDYHFGNMTIHVTHNKDGTISIEIIVYGE